MKQPSAFITGIAGFAGSWLAEHLVGRGWTVSGNVYKDEPRTNLAAIRKDVSVVSLDILNFRRCRNVIDKFQPDYIFHLAAVSSVGKSFQMERFTYEVNFTGSLNMLEAARHVDGLEGFVVVSSADSYGIFRPKDKTLTEDQPLNPVSPYGIAKAAAERTALYHHRQFGLPVVAVRAFNHSGPRQADSFVIPAFARQVALIEAGKQKPVVKVGDLSARRDLSDVRDIVRGYRLLAEKGKRGEVYHLSSGRAVTIRRVLDLLIGMSDKKIRVETDPDRLRSIDIPCLRGSSEKAYRQVGFTPQYRLRQTLADTLAYWRKQVRG